MKLTSDRGLGALLAMIMALTGLIMHVRVGKLADLYISPGLAELATGVRESSQPRGGESALPRQARLGISLLRDAGVESFRIDGELAAKLEFSQRIAEGAWPIRHRSSSQFVISLAGDVGTSCRVLGNRREVALAECLP